MNIKLNIFIIASLLACLVPFTSNAQNHMGFQFVKHGDFYKAGFHYESLVRNQYMGPFGLSDRLSINISYNRATSVTWINAGYYFEDGQFHPRLIKFSEEVDLYGFETTYALIFSNDITKNIKLYFGPGLAGLIHFHDDAPLDNNYKELHLNALAGAGYAFSPKFGLFVEIDYRYPLAHTSDLIYDIAPIRFVVGFRLL